MGKFIRHQYFEARFKQLGFLNIRCWLRLKYHKSKINLVMTYREIQERYKKEFNRTIKTCWIADIK